MYLLYISNLFFFLFVSNRLCCTLRTVLVPIEETVKEKFCYFVSKVLWLSRVSLNKQIKHGYQYWTQYWIPAQSTNPVYNGFDEELVDDHSERESLYVQQTWKRSYL